MILKEGEILPDERCGERGGKKYVRFFVHAGTGQRWNVSEKVWFGVNAPLIGMNA